MEAKIFTDGSCIGNPGPGGFCAIIKIGTREFIIKGGHAHTTNNRMELSAVIAGLYAIHKKFPDAKKCAIFSDSNLIVATMNHHWKRKKNQDLWEKLDKIRGKFEEISWHWIKGHAGHPENTKADKIALSQAIQSIDKKKKRTKIINNENAR